MARRELNIFSLSFLDLISGAFGAVVLLFVIVPKMDVKMQEELEAMQNLNVQVEQLEDILEQARNSIPQEVYEEIERQMNALKEAIQELEQEVENLQEQIAECQEQVESLEAQIREQQETIESQESQIEDLEEKVQACEDSMEVISGQAKFAIVTMGWDTVDDDVDMYVTDPTGAKFYYNRQTIAGRPGMLSKDDTEGPGFEVWQISVAEFGTYTIEADLYASESGENPEIETIVYYRNGTRKLKKVRLSQEGRKVRVGTFTIKENGDFSFSN